MGRDKSIEEIIGRAKNEKEMLLSTIEELLNVSIPQTSYDLSVASDFLKDLLAEIGFNYIQDNDAQDILKLYTEKLTALKKDLEEFEINEESLLSDESSIINRAQEVVPLVEPALRQIKKRFYDLNKEGLIAEYNNKEENTKKIVEKQKEIKELEVKKAYLEGQLSNIKRKKTRLKIEEEINSINGQINSIESELEKLNSSEEKEEFQEKAQKEVNVQNNNEAILTEDSKENEQEER